METTATATTEKKSFFDQLKEAPEQLWERYSSFSLFKKVLIAALAWWLIDDLSKNTSFNPDDFFNSITSLPKTIWANFRKAPGGKKFAMFIAAYYIVKNLFPKKEVKA